MSSQSYFYDSHSHEGSNEETIAVQNIVLGEDNSEIETESEQLYSVGIHPWFVKKELYVQQLNELKRLVAHNNVVAVGECGLDKQTSVSWDDQLKVFEYQVELSENIKKPLVVHSVRANSEILQIRKAMKAKEIWLMHGFDKSLQMAQQLISAGCVISVGHRLLNEAGKNLELIQNIPTESLLIESDEERALLKNIYHKVATLKKLSIEELKQIQQNNFKRLYKIET